MQGKTKLHGHTVSSTMAPFCCEKRLLNFHRLRTNFCLGPFSGASHTGLDRKGQLPPHYLSAKTAENSVRVHGFPKHSSDLQAQGSSLKMVQERLKAQNRGRETSEGRGRGPSPRLKYCFEVLAPVSNNRLSFEGQRFFFFLWFKNKTKNSPRSL